MENIINPEDLELFMAHSTLGIGTDSSSYNAGDQNKEEYYQCEDMSDEVRETDEGRKEHYLQREKYIRKGKDTSAERGYQCDLCGMKFTKNWNLTRHLVIHTERYKDFRCDICGKDFYRKSNLDRHLVIHEKDRKRNYQCNICGKDFLHKVNLNSHLLIHSGVKDFKCHLCGKEFPRNTDLKEHLLRHARQKEFPCEVCGKVFFQKGYLSKHLLVHSNERKRNYQCDFCGQEFSQKSHIIEHTIKVHALEENSQCQVSKQSSLGSDKPENLQTQQRDILQTEAKATGTSSELYSACGRGETSAIRNEGNGSLNIAYESQPSLAAAEVVSYKEGNVYRQ